MNLSTSLDSISKRILLAAPLALRRELMSGSDRSIRHGLEFVGNPRLPDDIALLVFGPGKVRASLLEQELRRSSGALAVGHTIPLAAIDQFDWFRQTPGAFPQQSGPGFGAPGGMGGGGGQPTPARVRRHPYAIFGQTTLNPGPGVQTPGDSGTFQNGTGFDFIVTHVTLSQDQSPLRLAPTYRLQIAPQYGLPWSPQSQRPDASAFLTHLSPFVFMPTNSGALSSRWAFEGASYVLHKSQGLFVAVQNNGDEAIQATVLLLASKRNTLASPRLFADTKALAAGAQQTPLPTSSFTNDGDFEAEIEEIHVTSGIGNWGVTAPTAPLVFIRPSNDREFMNAAALAPALNTTPGSLGAFHKLKTPQRIPQSTSIALNFEETTGQSVIANVGFVGYLEVPQS